MLYNILNQGARTYVGLFTTAGRALTAGKMAKGALEKSQEMRLLTNPEALYEAIMTAKKLTTRRNELRWTCYEKIKCSFTIRLRRLAWVYYQIWFLTFKQDKVNRLWAVVSWIILEIQVGLLQKI